MTDPSEVMVKGIRKMSPHNMPVTSKRGDVAPTHSQPGTRRRWVACTTLRPLSPPGKTHYTLNRIPGRPRGRSEWLRKIPPPPGRDPRTVQPVASRYTTALPRLPKIRHQQCTSIHVTSNRIPGRRLTTNMKYAYCVLGNRNYSTFTFICYDCGTGFNTYEP